MRHAIICSLRPASLHRAVIRTWACALLPSMYMTRTPPRVSYKTTKPARLFPNLSPAMNSTAIEKRLTNDPRPPFDPSDRTRVKHMKIGNFTHHYLTIRPWPDEYSPHYRGLGLCRSSSSYFRWTY